MSNHKIKKVILCILDGFGLGDPNNPNNAVAKAKKPNIDNLIKKFGCASLETSGEYVGLDDGQMGNSEVGHITIGSGRIVRQSLPEINYAIKNGDFEKNQTIVNSIQDLKSSEKSLHLIGLYSSGGVHSHKDHIRYIANLYAKSGINVILHLITDGRDVSPKSFINEIDEINLLLSDKVKIGTISGRYYVMDRDKRDERTSVAFDAIYNGKSDYETSNLYDYIKQNYTKDITDEFIPATIFADYSGIKDGDHILFANFRADRMRQIVKLINEKKSHSIKTICMKEYYSNLSNESQILSVSDDVSDTLSEIYSRNNFRQIKIAETEKYPHVTFFLNGGIEKPFPMEDRVLVPSPKIPTYDMQPEMSAYQVKDEVINAIKAKYELIVVNFANCDMVGHTGNINAAINAIEHIDNIVGDIYENISDYCMIISADHGNVEEMFDHSCNEIHTQHTTGPVPIIICDSDRTYNVKNGGLKDIAPTILNIAGIEIPKSMTGKPLI
jgi:2,3-bisphosphoglycerate-independent phosphoglycerate mutase